MSESVGSFPAYGAAREKNAVQSQRLMRSPGAAEQPSLTPQWTQGDINLTSMMKMCALCYLNIVFLCCHVLVFVGSMFNNSCQLSYFKW